MSPLDSILTIRMYFKTTNLHYIRHFPHSSATDLGVIQPSPEIPACTTVRKYATRHCQTCIDLLAFLLLYFLSAAHRASLYPEFLSDVDALISGQGFVSGHRRIAVNSDQRKIASSQDLCVHCIPT